MRLREMVAYLHQQQQPGELTHNTLRDWHRHEDTLKFLLSTTDNEVPIYIAGKGFFVYSLIVPL